MTALALLALSACVQIGSGSDRVLAADLAQMAPEFAALPPEKALGFAPLPGVRRVFQPPELRRLAAAAGLQIEPEREICVERRMAALAPEAIIAAMRRELPGARIELLAAGPSAAPEGELEFPLAGLQQKSEGAVWRGYVRYANGRRFSVWATVRVFVKAPRVVAAVDLKPGRVVEAQELRAEDVERPFRPGVFAASVDEVAGRPVRRAVPAGAVIEQAWMAAPLDVLRGEMVRVEVRAGGARLALDAKAEGSGAIGDRITVLNPETKKRFSAWITGKGTAAAGNKSL